MKYLALILALVSFATAQLPSTFKPAGTKGEGVDVAEFNAALKVRYDVFIIAGQSNTCSASWGYDSTLDEFAELAAIRQLNRTAPGASTVASPNAVPLTTPLQHWSVPSLLPGYLPWQRNFVGFDRYFAREYIQRGNLANGRRVLIVPCARPGSSFTAGNWGVGNTNYLDLVAMTQWVQTNLPGSVLRGLLWHQGESDVGTSGYAASLDAMFSAYRSAIGISDLPIVVGGMVPIWTNSAAKIAHQDIIRSTPNRLAYTAYADPERPTWLPIWKGGDIGDDIHFDVTEQRAFGIRYYEAWLSARQNDGVAKVPEGIRSITAAPSVNGTITLRFPAPRSNGAAISSYIVNHWSGATPAYNVSPTVSTFTDRGDGPSDRVHELTVTGLTDATVYTFQVAAANSAGTGPFSSEVSATTATATTAFDSSMTFHAAGESFLNRGTAGGFLDGIGTSIRTSDRGPAWYAQASGSGVLAPTPTASTAYSVSFWFQPKMLNHGFFNLANQQWLVDGNTIRSLVNGTTLCIGFGGNPVIATPITVSADTWYHLYIGWNGSTSLTYSLNNAAATTVACSGGSSPDYLRFGGNYGGGAFFGNMRQIRIYNRELTGGERTTIYGIQ